MAIRESGPKSYRFRDDIGHRLLPHVVDELAQTDPDRVLYEFPPSNDRLSDTFVHVTARQYANAINRTAWWLENALGRRPSSPTVGYEGPQDLRYYLLVIAAVKTGYKMLFTSPRNTVEGDLAVIRGAQCGIWLLPNHGSHAGRLLEHVSLETLTLPDLDFFLDPATVPHFEYLKDWEAGRRDYAWVLHTSGSTGNPKPVFRFLDSVASVGANNLLPRINGKPLLLHDYYDTRAYLTFPFYHGAGLVNGMLWPIYHGTTIILGPQRPVSLDLMKQVIRRTEPTSVFTAPSLVEEISKDAEFLELLQGVEALAYGGGPVSFEAGDRIWKHTKLRLSIGTTEAGWLPCVETDPEDWNYIHPHPNCGFQFRPHADGLYELIAMRQPHLAQWQSIFSTFPDLDEYNTRDLFSRHATKEGHYKYEGRADNIIVLSNGEKVQPNNMELVIGAHPLIKAAIIAGQGRFQTSAIVEVLETSYPRNAGERRALIEQILPSIDAANKLAPTHGKLDPDLIVFGHPAKPFQRTPKSTIRRGPTIQLYAEELDQAYAQAELAGDSEAKVRHPVKLQSQETLEESLRELILSVVDLEVLDKNADLFADTGVDSLQVMTIRRRLVRGLPRDSIIQAGAITGALIYKNPTVCQLAAAILNLARNEDIKSYESAESRRLADDLLLKYTKDLPPRLDGSRDETPNSDYHIVLTGSTGSLGSYILDHLIQTESVKEVWCLNRSADAESRQARLNAKRGLRSDFEASNVRFLQAKLSEERLGLQETDYNDISDRVTHIIDVQWQVDFNLSLASFEPRVRGVRNLVDLAYKGSNENKTVKIIFTSSVGVANNHQTTHQVAIPEEPITDWGSAGTGYGESKLVSERILGEASARSGIQVTICRVGQIAGPVLQGHESGEWNRREWLPSLIDASAHLSLLPETLGRNETVDWIPVDLLSAAIFEIGTTPPSSSSSRAAQIVHAVNPQTVQWKESLLPVVERYLNGNTKNGQPVEIISLDGWVKALHAAALGESGESDVQGNLSAFKLLPFFTGLLNGDPRPAFETVRSSALSITLKELPAVGARWVAVWLEQWKYQVTHPDSNLFAPLKVGRASLSHRIVMAPMTRRRAAIDFVPTPLMVEYYAQRASVPGTFLISEATAISPRSASPPNTPGIWSDAQMDAWKGVTTAVHARGSFIYMQLWVVGRAIRSGALEQGAEAISSGDVPVGPDSPVPRPLREEELQDLIAEFREAAKKAILAGFDGVELHGANGYLLDQFTQDVSNNRTDQWGGSIENRCRFPLAVAKAVASAIGPDKVGYRISPWSRHHGMRMADPVPQFSHLVSRLRELRLSYLHVIESRVQGPMDIPSDIASESVQFAADIWGETSPIIFAGGYNAHSARQKTNEEAEKGRQGLVAFGRTFLSNPDLPTRIQRLLPVTRYIRDLFYEAGKSEGYVDYLSWAEEELRSDGGLSKEHIWPTGPSAVLQ